MNGLLMNVLDGNIVGGLSRAISEDPLTNRPPGAVAVGWTSTGRRLGPDPDAALGTRVAGGAEREGSARG